MKNRYFNTALIALFAFSLTTSLFAQGRAGAGARGAAPRGEGAAQNRGAREGNADRRNEVAAQRKAIQAQQKAAIKAEDSRFKLAMMSLQQNAKNAKDDNARAVAKTESEAARRNHQAELQRIRAAAQAAIKGLGK